jgi:Holliday junction resolvase RusA-like endonuclease
MAKQKRNTIQEALEYHQKYGSIPKNYMERLSWLYDDIGFTEKQLYTLIDKIDELATVQWDELRYIFYMMPKPTPRARSSSATNTFHFYVGGAKFNKDIMERFMEEHSDMECVISTPTKLDTKVYMPTPKGMNTIEKMAAELELIHNINAPDWDNLGKTYSDMVQDVLISNDSIVSRGCIEKFYSILPRIEVTIRFMKSFDCKYNKRTVEGRKSFKENDKTVKNIDYII